MVCLSFAGFMGTWLMSREWQEKTIAASVMILPLLLAFLQYRGTYRAHVRSAFYAEIIACLLCLGSAMPLIAAIFHFGNVVVEGFDFSGGQVVAWAGAILQPIFLGIVVWHNESWRAELEQATEEDRLPASPLKITLKEIFLLILAVAFMAGVASYFVRHGYHYQLLF